MPSLSLKKHLIKSLTFILLISIILVGCAVNGARSETGYPAVGKLQEAAGTPPDSIEITQTATLSPVPNLALEHNSSGTKTPALASTLSGTVTIWHSWTENELAGLEKIINAFQIQSPAVVVELKYIPSDDLLTRFISESAEAGPNLLIGSSSWGPEFYDAGLIADMSRIAKPKFLEKIGEAALETVKYKNVLIGLPVSYNRGIVIFRNRSILPKSPQILSEYLESAMSVTRGDTIGAVIDLGFLNSGAFLSTCGGRLMDARGFPLFDNTVGLCWIDLLKSIQESGLPIVYNSDLDLDRFKTGKIGFIIAGTWETASLAEAIGEENLAIDPWPATEKSHLSGFLETDVIYLNKNVAQKNLAAARALMRYFLSPRAQKILADPATIAKPPTVIGIDIPDRLTQEAVVAFENGTPLPGIPAMDYYWGPMDDAIRSVLMEDEEPKLALEKAADRINVRVKNLIANR